MQKNRSKLQQIIFILSLFVILFIGAVSYKHVTNISEAFKLVSHTYKVNLELEKLFSYIKDSENSMRGFLFSNDTLYIKSYDIANRNINHSFKKLQKLTSNNKKQQQNVDRLHLIIKELLNNNVDYIDPDIEKDITRNYHLRTNFYTNSKLLAEIREIINEMSDLEDSYFVIRNLEYDKQISFTPVFTIVALIIALFILFLSQYRLNKNLTNLEISNLQLSKSVFLNNHAEILSEFGSWEWDIKSHVTTYSENFYRILGYEPYSVSATNENFMNFVHPEDKQLVADLMDKIAKKEDLPPVTYRIIKSNGDIRVFSVTGKLFYDAQKNNVVIGVTRDITEEVHKEKLLKNNIEELKELNAELTIYDESSKQAEILGKYGGWVLNFETGKFSYSDNKFRLMGYEAQAFDPSIENLINHVHPEDRHIVINASKKIASTFEFPTINYRVIRKDGEIRRFKTIAKSFTDKNGTHCMIGTTQDITEDYFKSKLLSERNSELEQNIKELNEFNHVASHDLQEPLRKIQTFISRIKDKESDNLSDFGNDYIERIEKASNRMRVLINDLLQYSRTNRSDKNFIDVNLNELVLNTTIELSQVIEDKKAIIDKSNLISIQGVEFQLQQLFTNLISNSLKYCKPDITPIIEIKGTPVIAKNEIQLKDESYRKYYKLSITDNGIGFEQENAEKIFLLFNRLHGKTEFQGTGVGLAICKKIVENHNGFIFATSKPNIGSIFTIYLPLSN